MKVWGVYDDEIEALAQEVGLRILFPGVRRDGRGYRFRLGLHERREDGRLKFQKLNYYGVGSGSVCWHGHREFMFALFRDFPEARLQTALADYWGRADFRARYLATRGQGGFHYLYRDMNCACNPHQRSRPERTSVVSSTGGWPPTFTFSREDFQWRIEWDEDSQQYRIETGQ